MVWDSSSSTLYKAVLRHNSSYSGAPFPEEEEYDSHNAEEHRENSGVQSGGILPLSGLDGLFSGDSDSLLLAALILVLMHEKADIKLIMALGFVLLA